MTLSCDGMLLRISDEPVDLAVGSSSMISGHGVQVMEKLLVNGDGNMLDCHGITFLLLVARGDRF